MANNGNTFEELPHDLPYKGVKRCKSEGIICSEDVKFRENWAA